MTTPTLPARDAASRSVSRDAVPFLALTFLLTWGLWAVAVGLGGDVADPAVFACYAIGACGPSLAAGVLRVLGRPGGSRTSWASAPRWLPAAVLVGAAPALLAAAVPALLGGAPLDPAVLGADVAAAGGPLPFLAVALVAGPLAEEFGWRGYLQPVLRRRFGPAGTAALVGSVWAVWHVPLFLLAGTVQARMGLLTPAALGFFVAMVPMSVGYWFVAERLRGGVPAAVLVHLAGNTALTFLLAAPSVVGGVTYLATLVLIAAVLLAGPGRAGRDADVGTRTYPGRVPAATPRVEEPPFHGRAPAPGLRSYVTGYTGYRSEAGPRAVHKGVASPHLTVILCLDGAVEMLANPDPARRPGTFGTLVSGLHDGPAEIAAGDPQSGVQVRLTWRGARALLGLPASELAGDTVDLAAVLGRRVGPLRERLAEQPDWPTRFALLDAALADLAAGGRGDHGVRPEVGHAWDRLVETGGNLRIGELAAEVGWSRRHLSELFRAETGVGPKAAARLIRFERACDRLRGPHRAPLATVAADAGYVDQAHLSRDFRDLAGLTATEWLAERDLL